MRRSGSHIIYTPSDLMVFFESPFASWMDRQRIEAPELAKPDPDDGETALWAAVGAAHEAAVLEDLRAEHGSVWKPPEDGNPFEATFEAMRRGEPVIYQGVLRAFPFEGRPDFLFRREIPSVLGSWSYTAVDAKLSRQPKPYFLIQLAAYAEMLERVQEARPSEVEIRARAGERHAFRIVDFLSYYLALKRAFISAQEVFALDAPPLPDGRADHQRWQTHADRILEKLDHVSRVAAITRLQMKRLADAKITSMRSLAECSVQRIARMDPEIYERLRDQASLQVLSRGRATPEYRVLPPEQSRPRSGLARLPPASPMDVYFDMEGFPVVEGGLEYLFGAFYIERGASQFKDFWAHDRTAEGHAFEQFVDWVCERYDRDPSMHIYHYARYEVTALKRLAATHVTREDKIDILLRNEVFVDLYQVVGQAIRVGEPRYSLKNVEKLYRSGRSGEVATAAQSIVEYARWLAERDGDTWASSKILAGIRDYNRDDCESTWQLAEWLRQRQKESRIGYIAPAARTAEEEPVPVRWQPAEETAANLRAEIEKSSDPMNRRIGAVLSQLVTFHRRESKPTFSTYYRHRDEMTDPDLREDPDCIADARATGRAPEPFKQSLLYEYTFDAEQETSITAGDKCELRPGGRRVIVHEIAVSEGRLVLKAGERGEPLPPSCSLIPFDYIDPQPIDASIRRIAENWGRTKSLRPAVADILLRRAPRVRGHDPSSPLIRGDHVIDELTDCLDRAEQTCIPVQGPPGSGKTYAIARVVAALLRLGRRVAVTSNSHRTIDRVLVQTHQSLGAAAGEITAAKVGDDHYDDDVELPVPRLRNRQQLIMSKVPPQLVGATAWTLSAPELEDAFDFLIVDEAGQVSLANLVGMAPCARTVVLVGDQMQLAQPTKGAHPGDSGASALQYVLQDHAVVPDNRGVFLASTRRLHPEVCRFVSDVFYEGRLSPHPSTSTRWIRPQTARSDTFLLPRAGIASVPCQHEGNGRSSPEEVATIVALTNALTGYEFVTEDGAMARPVTFDDVIVVTPYNAQVQLLRASIPGLRVGTVDRFQGEEAPIVIVSMCTSAGEESPRGLEFLFSPNRLNVAISRAQVLAVIVAHPGLARTRASSLAQMRCVNRFCRLVDDAAQLSVVPSVVPPTALGRTAPRMFDTRGPERPLAVSSSNTRWAVDERALGDFVKSLNTPSSPEWFHLRREAEALALTPSFDRLITLDCNRIEELPHQIAVAKQVLRRPMSGRAILADEVGLGKTIEAGIIYKELAARGLAQRVLILAPAALVEQWREELATKFYEEFETPREPSDWRDVRRAIISYDRARTQSHAEAILQHRWDLVIADEAHKVKNHQTLTYQVLQQVHRNFLLLLTATPLQNSLRELYNLVTLLRPGQLGTWSDFRRKYVQSGDVRKAKNPEALRELTAQVMVRTRRANVASVISLPPRRPRHPRITLSTEERRLYGDTTQFLRDLYKGGFYQPTEAEEDEDRVRKRRFTGRGNLSRMMVLLCQRLCSSAAALANSLENLSKGELVLPEYRARALDLAGRAHDVRQHAKLETLNALLAEAPNERFIVFTEHLPTVELVKQCVAGLGRAPIVFAGTIPRPDRNERIGRFRDTPGSVFVATRAGSEGLNLQFCSRVVNYELPWNPMVIEQRIGRVHRIGQRQEVEIFNFAADGTIEMHVLRLLDQKIKLFELVVGELDVILGKFGEPEDLEKQLREAWLSSESDEDFEAKVTQIGDALSASRQEGQEQERLATEVAAEDPGTRLVQEFDSLTVAARVRLGYGTGHLRPARGVDAKRMQLGVRVPGIMEALERAHSERSAHHDYGAVYKLAGVTGRGRAIQLTVQADRLPMVWVDVDATPEAPFVGEA